VSGIRRDPRARFGLAVLAAAAVVAAAAPAVSSGRPAAQRDLSVRLYQQREGHLPLQTV
jgi:hypothetical protein